MKKIYNSPEAELVKIDTRDVMSVSLGEVKDPYKTQPSGWGNWVGGGISN